MNLKFFLLRSHPSLIFWVRESNNISIENKTKLTDEKIFNNTGFDSTEFTQLSVINAVLKPYHAGLIVKNFRIVTDYDEIDTTHAFMEPLRVDTRTAGFIDCDFRIQGTLLFAETTAFNWHMENIVFETQYLYRISFARLVWGDTNTTLGTTTFFKNITGINSGVKPVALHKDQSTFRIYVPHHIHMEDFYYDTFIGYKIDLSNIVIYHFQSDCIEEEGNVQTFNLTNIHLRTSRYEKGVATTGETNTFILAPFPNGTRKLQVFVDNFTCTDDYHYRFFCTYLFPGLYSNIVAKNFYSINSGGALHYFAGDSVTFDNLVVKNSTVGNENLLDFFGIYHFQITNVIIEDSVITSNNLRDILNINLLFGLQGTIDNIQIKNVEISSGHGLINLVGFNFNAMVVQNIHFENITMKDSTTLLGYRALANINITGITGNKLIKSDDESDTSTLLRYYYTNTSTSVNSVQTFNDILIDDSTVTFLDLTKSDYSTAVTQSLVLTNFTYQNHQSESSSDLFKIYNLATAGSYTIELNDITFSNLTFNKESKLMHLQHQLDTSLVINNLKVSDIKFAGITIESFRLNEFSNSTRVIINNMTAFNVDGKSRSLININTGANVEIVDSVFYYVGNYDKGAVMYAGKESAVATFRSSTFYNNTSVEGGVFSSDSQSNIKWYNWTFTNNFAINSGVIKVGEDGQFEFYNSNMNNNKALTGVISEIFSTQLESVVDNWSISNNVQLSSDLINQNILTLGIFTIPN